MGISLSGLVSGLDWQTLVTNLMTAERTPETAWTAQQSANTAKITSLAQIKSNLTDLQTAAKALNDDSVFGGRSASISDSSSGWNTSAAANALTGQHTFEVSSLATSAQLTGTPRVAAKISASSIVSAVTVPMMHLSSPPTPGMFSVDGIQIVVNSTDSLQDVFDKIASATHQAVMAQYNTSSDTISLVDQNHDEIVLGSSADTSNFLSAMKLYTNGSENVTSASALSVVDTSAALAHSNLKNAITDTDTDGKGSFSINGINIDFNVNTDSVQAVMDRINNSKAGVSIRYDKLADQFTLSSNATGDISLAVSENANGLLAALGLNSTATLTRGTNAQVKVDGGPTLTSTSNTFDAALTGITGLSVTATSEDTQTVTVGNDTSNATSKINDFISKYNALQSFIDSQSKSSTDSDGAVKQGVLAGDREVTSLASSLRQILFNGVPGLSGSIQRLDNIGIGFSGTSSMLAIRDSSKLNSALQNNPDAVQKLFGSQPSGLIAQINTFVQRNTASTGVIATETNSLTAASKSIDTQIAALESHIAQDQARLTNGFVAMEQALSAIQSQTQTLDSYFGTSSSSSSSKKSS